MTVGIPPSLSRTSAIFGWATTASSGEGGENSVSCPLPFLYPPPVGPPAFLAVNVAEGAVVAHPKIAEVREREGEIPTVNHQLRLVLL